MHTHQNSGGRARKPLTDVNRRLHLVDIENLIGNPHPNTSHIRKCQTRYLDIAHPGEFDLVVVGCSHWYAKLVMFEWTGARFVVRSGPDGADMALLEVWDDLATSHQRFAEVLVGSGDHIFTDLSSRIAAEGIPVTVISRPDSLALSLRVAAGRTFSFDETDSGPAEMLPQWRPQGRTALQVQGNLAVVGGRL